MIHHRRHGVLRATAIVALAGLLLAACGGDDSSSSNAGDDTTTTIEETTTTEAPDATDTTDTTVAAGTEETTTTLGTSGTTLPGGTPTTARRTTTTVRRPGATTTTVKKPGATTTTAKPGVAKGTIKVGVMDSETNARGQAQTPEGRQIGKAWVDMANAAGGINGYKFELVYKNVNGDPARALNAIKEMDREDVIAFTQSDASVLPGLRDYMSQKSLPVVAGEPYTNEFDWHPMFFHFTGQAIGVYGQVAAARDVGAKHFRNFYCLEVAACATSVPETKYAAEREGLKFSSEGGSFSAPDYTANCLSAKNAGVDFFQANGPPLANIVRDCTRQNYHPTYAQGGAANQAVIDSVKGESAAGNLYEFGIFYDGPEIQRFRQALARTDQKVADGTATQSSIHVWLGLELMGAVAKKMTQANPTRQNFLDAFYTLKAENLDGQIATTDFSAQKPGTGKHATSDCWTEHIIKDGKLYHMTTKGQIATRLTFICGTGLKLNDKASPM